MWTTTPTKRGEDRRRRAGGLAVALALHGALFAVAGGLVVTRAHFPLLDANLRLARTEVDVDVDSDPAPPERLGARRAAPNDDESALSVRTAGPQTPRPVPARRSSAGASRDEHDAAGPDPAHESGRDEWSEPTQWPRDEGGLARPLSLAWDARLDLVSAPAPTRAPRPRPLPEGIEELAITSALRAHNAELGLGNPEENAVATAVQTAGRAAAVPKDTRFRVEIDLDTDGRVMGARVASASAGDEATWAGVLGAIRRGLGERVEIGPDVRRAGARLIVDAEVKHVFVSGSDEAVTTGACPTDPHTSGMWDAVPFHWVGGAAYGDYATGTCPLSDVTNSQPKQIQVRTKTTAVLPGAPPAPLSTFGSAKKPFRMPSIWELIFPK